MNTLNLVQGSPEWLLHRQNHFNASDAPAMMGVSSYKTRSQLLKELATGIRPEVEAGVQQRFDEGHRCEALARPLAEEIIGEDVYPVVGVSGRLSASFDGLTMLDDTAFEHKLLNDRLREAMHSGCTGTDLPPEYQVQMEQQCMVSGCTRVLFMASKWRGDELVEERHCWYQSNPELAARIAAGWEQFGEDLSSYAPEAVEVTPTGRTPETLPALHIAVTGMVTASNLDAFKEHALKVFGGINRELETDQDFADAEKAVKWCGDVEERLEAAKQHALSQTESIDILFRTIDDVKAEARRARLDLEKLVKARKEFVRGEIVAGGVRALAEHIQKLDDSLQPMFGRVGVHYMPAIPADFGLAIKGKKNLDSMRDAVATVLANAKIEANAVADRIRRNLATLTELASDHASLFPDKGQIVLKQNDDFTMLVKTRISEHEESEARKKSVAAEAPAPAPAPAAALLVSEPVARLSIPVTAPAGIEEQEPRTLKLGEINTILSPVAISSDGLKALGFAPVAKERAALLYSAAILPDLRDALIQHINNALA